MDKRDGLDPRAGTCPKCERETGGLKVHARACKGKVKGGLTKEVHAPTLAEYRPSSARKNPQAMNRRTRPTSYPAPLVGGPLHGRITAPAVTKRTYYLDREGRKMETRKAERFLQGRSRTVTGLYALREAGRAGEVTLYWYRWISFRPSQVRPS